MHIEYGLLSYPYLVSVFQGSHYKEGKNPSTFIDRYTFNREKSPPLLTVFMGTAGCTKYYL